MKQHITIEQLNELTDEGIRKLAKWLDLEEFDETTMKIWRESTGKWDTDNLLLSIGEMMEFLDEHTKQYPHFCIRIARTQSDGFVFPRGTLVTLIDGLPISSIEDEPDVCDALWEAVKEVLIS